MSTNKRAYQAALKEIRTDLGDDVADTLKTIEHYVGELRRDKAAGEAKVSALEQSHGTLQQRLNESTSALAKQQEQLQAVRQQLQTAVGQLRQEKEGTAKLVERMNRQTQVYKFAFSQLINGGDFIVSPGSWHDDRSFQLCISIENVLPRIVTGLVGTIADGYSAPRSGPSAREMTMRLTEEKLGIGRERYEEILRSTIVARDSITNYDPPPSLGPGAAIDDFAMILVSEGREGPS